MRGLDVGLKYALDVWFNFTDSLSLIELSDFDQGDANREPLLNVPNTKVKGSVTAQDVAIDNLTESHAGRILNAASIVGRYGNFGQTSYVTTKSGVIGMTKTWARELGRDGVTVNAVAPGFVDTNMMEMVPDEIIEQRHALSGRDDFEAYAEANAHSVAGMLEGDVRDRLGEIDVPTLLVASAEDYTPVAAKERIVARMPNAELTVVDDIRHRYEVERRGDRKPSTPEKRAAPMIAQSRGKVRSPTVMGKGSGSPICWPSQSPRKAPMKPTMIEIRHPPWEYPERAWPRPPAMAAMSKRIKNWTRVMAPVWGMRKEVEVSVRSCPH